MNCQKKSCQTKLRQRIKTGNLPSESFGDRQQITTGSKAKTKELKFVALFVHN